MNKNSQEYKDGQISLLLGALGFVLVMLGPLSIFVLATAPIGLGKGRRARKKLNENHGNDTAATWGMILCGIQVALLAVGFIGVLLGLIWELIT